MRGQAVREKSSFSSNTTQQMILRCCGKDIKPRTQIQFSLASFLVLLLAFLVPYLAIQNNKASDRRSNTIVTGSIAPFDPPEGFNGVIVLANVSFEVEATEIAAVETSLRFGAIESARSLARSLNILQDSQDWITNI